MHSSSLWVATRSTTRTVPSIPSVPIRRLSASATAGWCHPRGGELSNQSKGDVLSKGVAVLQTVWFVVQCIARLVEHLPLTNLEVMTLAYTVMTVAMYVAWWDKPLNISCAIRVPGVTVEGPAKPQDIWPRTFSYVVGMQDEAVDLNYTARHSFGLGL